MEDAVNVISQIDEVRSTSSEGQSFVLVAFELSKNGDVAAQEVQNKINLIANDLPQTAKAAVVQKFDPDAAPYPEYRRFCASLSARRNDDRRQTA